MKRLIWGIGSLLCVGGALQGAPSANSRDVISAIKRELVSQQDAIHILQERQRNQDETIESIRAKVASAYKKPPQSNSEPLKKDLAHLTKDAKTLQKHANETSSTLSSLSKKLAELENHFGEQSVQIKRLEDILTQLTKAIAEESLDEDTYTVIHGDSLGEIALRFHTTVKAIKAINDLKKDRIVVGQKLIIPSSHD